MNKPSTSCGRLTVAIAGAGPAGSSLAIRLASAGHRVSLIERETFPRHKLCGEFISPECLGHFSELGVLDVMEGAGGEWIGETRFFARGGRSFAVASHMFGGAALSLSRSQMDEILLRRAAASGVEVLEGARIVDVLSKGHRLEELAAIEASGRERLVRADLFIDATGRSAALSKLVSRRTSARTPAAAAPPHRSLGVGFKTHLTDAGVPAGVCEIYFFPGGYAGLSRVEDGRANLCFLVSPAAARKHSGDGEALMTDLVRMNRRADETLSGACNATEWLAVSVNSFGEREPASAQNLLSVGDAAAFIDPFTGSGMLMAMEGASLLARTIGNAADIATTAAVYTAARRRVFRGRLRVCGALRWAAFMPVLSAAAIAFLEFSGRGRALLAGATRGRCSARV